MLNRPGQQGECLDGTFTRTVPGVVRYRLESLLNVFVLLRTYA